MTTRAAKFSVQFDISGDGQVTAKIGDIEKAAKSSGAAARDAGKDWEDFGHKIGTSLKYAGVAAVAGVALIVRNTIQAQKEMAQLDAVLLSTGNSAGYSRDQLVALAESIASTSTFSSGEILKAETRLLSYSGIASKNFPEALQIAIDQAARLGIGVEQSAETIGRALESPTKAAAALAQQGFGAAFTDAVKKSIKTLEDAGDVAGAQKIVIDILNESYQGAAEAARDTFGGAVEALTNTLSDLLTGDVDGEGLRGVQQSVESLISTLNSEDTRSGFASMVEGTFTLIDALAQLVGWLARAYSSTQDFLTIQAGGNRQSGGENIAIQRKEVEEIKAEQARRAKGGLGTSLMTYGNIAEAGLARIVGFEGIKGSTDNELRSRLAAAEQAISMNEMLFGDPNKPRIMEGDQTLPDRVLKRPTFTPTGGDPDRDPSGAKKSGTKKLTEEERAAIRLEKAYESVKLKLQEQLALTGEVTEAQQLSFDIQNGNLKGLSEEKAKELMQLAEKRDIQRDEIEVSEALAEVEKRRSQATKDLLADIQLETESLGMSNEQLEIRNNLLTAGVTAESERGQAIIAATKQLQEARETMGALNELQNATTDLAASAIYDFGSAGDAFENYIDRLRRAAAEALAEKAIQWLFGMVFGVQGANGANDQGGLIDLYSGSGFGFSTGGRVRGKGTSTSDSIPARLSDGEFVINAAAVNKYGADIFEGLNAQRFATGGPVGSVAGGGVGLGGPSIEFNVQNNAAGTEVTEPQVTYEMGKMLVSMAVNKINDGLARKGSTTHKSMMAGLGKGASYG